MNILIADDHPLYRMALATMLAELDEDITVIEADNFNKVINCIRDDENKINLLLLDLYMSGGNWREIIAIIHTEKPDIPIIIISSSESIEDTTLAMESGAHGYIPKSLGKKEILDSIKLMLSSGISITPRISTMLNISSTGIKENEIQLAVNNLTPRQREVLIEIVAGKSNKSIARDLNMVEGTVKLHVAAILRTLSVSNRTQAALLASQIDLSNIKPD